MDLNTWVIAKVVLAYGVLHSFYANGQQTVCQITATCYESTQADIVIAIDASTSFGAKSVKMAKDFSRDFIE